MKKLKNIIVMSIVLVVLIMAYLIFSPMWREDSGDSETTETPSYALPDLNADSLVGVEIAVTKEKENVSSEDTSAETSDETTSSETSEKVTETLSFSLSDDKTSWLWSEDSEIPLDNAAFANIVTALNDATSKYKLEGVSNEELAEYGLDEPYIRAKFTFSDGSVHEYKIGSYNSFNSLYYFADLSEPTTVYMVASSVPEALDLDIFDFILEETPPEITESNIISLTYSTPRGNRVYTYYPTGKESDYTDSYLWYCTDYYSDVLEYPVDGDIAEILVGLITELGFEDCVALDYAADSSDFDFTSECSVEIKYKADTDDSGVLTEKTYTLYIGNVSEDKVWIHTDNSKLVYLIESADDWNTVLNEDKASISPDELWLPNYERIDSMTFAAGENSIRVNVVNTDGKISYTSDVTDDADAISALLEALEKTAATSNTAYLEGDASAEKKTIFSLNVKFSAGDNSELEMKIEGYSEKYCRVYFNGRDDQLITLEDAEELVGLISAFFAEDTKAA